MAGTKRLARKWGGAIRAQRMRQGMSVQDLAEAVGVTRQAVYQWEDGETVPSPERHVAIANVLGIHPHLLFTYPDEVA